MQISKEIRLALWLLIGANIILAFSSIILIERMTPIIEQSANQNQKKITVIENTLTELILEKEDLSAQRKSLQSNLEQINSLKMDPTERYVALDTQKHLKQYIEGDQNIRPTLIRNLLSWLSEIRQKLQEANEKAIHLGTSGVWAIVFISLFIFILGLITLRLLWIRIVRPIQELSSVLKAQQQGDYLRRSRILPASKELFDIMTYINFVLDQRTHILFKEEEQPEIKEISHEQNQRIIQSLLEEFDKAAFLVNELGSIFASNEKGVELLSKEEGPQLRGQLNQVPVSTDQPLLKEVKKISKVNCWLCFVE